MKKKNLIQSSLLAVMLFCLAISHAQSKTIVETAAASKDFTTLVAAVKAVDLVGVLSSDGPFTVFAPTDAAFALLPEGLVATLLEDPSGQLTTILTHHVFAGSALSTDLYDGMMVPTIAGGELEVTETWTIIINQHLISKITEKEHFVEQEMQSA